MAREPIDDFVDRLREGFRVPPETPRDEMWAAIEARLGERSEDVIPIGRAMAGRVGRFRRATAWAAAAAAVMVVGVGIGRMTAPGPVVETASSADAVPSTDLLRAAALEHLGRTESLITLVRADARSGRVDPAVGGWARSLLAQTRLLLDRPESDDPTMRTLLEDLELVLVQIVGVADAGATDGDRARSELTLALEGIEEREVLPRIQAVVPAGPGLAGT